MIEMTREMQKYYDCAALKRAPEQTTLSVAQIKSCPKNRTIHRDPIPIGSREWLGNNFGVPENIDRSNVEWRVLVMEMFQSPRRLPGLQLNSGKTGDVGSRGDGAGGVSGASPTLDTSLQSDRVQGGSGVLGAPQLESRSQSDGGGCLELQEKRKAPSERLQNDQNTRSSRSVELLRVPVQLDPLIERSLFLAVHLGEEKWGGREKAEKTPQAFHSHSPLQTGANVPGHGGVSGAFVEERPGVAPESAEAVTVQGGNRGRLRGAQTSADACKDEEFKSMPGERGRLPLGRFPASGTMLATM